MKAARPLQDTKSPLLEILYFPVFPSIFRRPGNKHIFREMNNPDNKGKHEAVDPFHTR